MEEVKLGQYALPLILSVCLGIFYHVAGTIKDRFKPVIAVVCGIGLGLIALAYNSGPYDIKHIIDFVLYGLMQGAAAVGIYEVQRSAFKPRA